MLKLLKNVPKGEALPVGRSNSEETQLVASGKVTNETTPEAGAVSR